MDPLTVDAMTMEVIDPSLLQLTWSGRITAADIAGLTEFATRHHAGKSPPFGCIVDATQATGINRHARKPITDLGRTKPWEYVAVFGLSFQLQVVVEMLVKALLLMNMKTAEVHMFETEAEARAWLDEQLTR